MAIVVNRLYYRMSIPSFQKGYFALYSPHLLLAKDNELCNQCNDKKPDSGCLDAYNFDTSLSNQISLEVGN